MKTTSQEEIAATIFEALAGDQDQTIIIIKGSKSQEQELIEDSNLNMIEKMEFLTKEEIKVHEARVKVFQEQIVKLENQEFDSVEGGMMASIAVSACELGIYTVQQTIGQLLN